MLKIFWLDEEVEQRHQEKCAWSKKNTNASAREVQASGSFNASTKPLNEKFQKSDFKVSSKEKSRSLVSNSNRKKQLALAKKYVNKSLSFWDNSVTRVSLNSVGRSKYGIDQGKHSTIMWSA